MIKEWIKMLKQNNCTRELQDALSFYPKLTIYNYQEFTFKEINEYLDIEYKLKTT